MSKIKETVEKDDLIAIKNEIEKLDLISSKEETIVEIDENDVAIEPRSTDLNDNDESDYSRLTRKYDVKQLPLHNPADNRIFVKLERGNDWGSEYFSLPGKSKSKYGTCSKNDLGILFADGMKIFVRWPNGESTETIAHEKKWTQISDMGYTYDCIYELAGFNANIHGVIQWLPLDAVEILIDDSFPKAKSDK
jgi:hypothetical protein